MIDQIDSRWPVSAIAYILRILTPRPTKFTIGGTRLRLSSKGTELVLVIRVGATERLFPLHQLEGNMKSFQVFVSELKG